MLLGIENIDRDDVRERERRETLRLEMLQYLTFVCLFVRNK
jgi:hypothetical protein